MRLTLIFSTLFLSISIYAQVENILKNPDIVWAAETETMIPLAEIDHLRQDNSDIGLQTLKTDFSKSCHYEAHKLIGEEIEKVLASDQYRITDLKGNRISYSQIRNMLATIDTIITFDPNTFKETTQVVRSDVDLTSKMNVKIRQIWYYNQKDKSLNTKVLAIAPSVKIETTDVHKPICWIELRQNENFDFNINREALIWSRISTHITDFKDAKTLKGNTREALNLITFHQPVNGERNAYSANRRKCSDLLSTNQIKGIFESSIDTIITFSPKDLSESIEIVQNKAVNPSDLEKYRVIQQWYWDTEKQNLAVKLKALEPRSAVKSKSGKHWYKPAYILKFE